MKSKYSERISWISSSLFYSTDDTLLLLTLREALVAASPVAALDLERESRALTRDAFDCEETGVGDGETLRFERLVGGLTFAGLRPFDEAAPDCLLLFAVSAFYLVVVEAGRPTPRAAAQPLVLTPLVVPEY